MLVPNASSSFFQLTSPAPVNVGIVEFVETAERCRHQLALVASGFSLLARMLAISVPDGTKALAAGR